MLANDRNTPARPGLVRSFLAAANVLLYAGALAAVDAAGHVTPGATATGLRGIGRVRAQVNNSAGSAGDLAAEIETGIFRFDNSANADAITQADVDQPCYIVDDHTVAKTNGANTRSRAGIVHDVDDQGVWVKFGDGVGNKIYLPLRIDDLAGADTKVYGITSPVAGKITNILSSLEGHALATGDATITGKINGVAITTGVVTITNAASAIGDQDSAQPTAANAVAPGDRINFTVGGTNNNAVAYSQLLIEITT